MVIEEVITFGEKAFSFLNIQKTRHNKIQAWHNKKYERSWLHAQKKIRQEKVMDQK